FLGLGIRLLGLRLFNLEALMFELVNFRLAIRRHNDVPLQVFVVLFESRHKYLLRIRIFPRYKEWLAEHRGTPGQPNQLAIFYFCAASRASTRATRSFHWASVGKPSLPSAPGSPLSPLSPLAPSLPAGPASPLSPFGPGVSSISSTLVRTSLIAS